MIAKYDLSNNLSLAGRLEFYSDENGVIIPSNPPNGFQTLGYSLNLDYAVTENALWRIEARSFNSKDLIFMNEGTPTDTNFFLGTSMSVRF